MIRSCRIKALYTITKLLLLGPCLLFSQCSSKFGFEPVEEEKREEETGKPKQKGKLYTRFVNEEKDNELEFIEPRLCTNLRKSQNNECDEKTWKHIQRNWLEDPSNLSTYLTSISEKIGNHSTWIHDVTYTWAKRFNKRAEEILARSSSSFICQLAAVRWQRSKHKTPIKGYFGEIWKPAAEKCFQFLEKVRRASFCLMCDHRNYESRSILFKENILDERSGLHRNEFKLTLSQRDCNLFVKECLDYINEKEEIVEKFNLELTLLLCENGEFTAWGDKEERHKILPSQTIIDREDREICTKHSKEVQSFLSSEKEVNQAEEESCRKICKNYFSLNLMIFDDWQQFNNFRFTHHIVAEYLAGNGTKSLFEEASNHIIYSNSPSMETVIFDFKSTRENSKKKKKEEGGTLEEEKEDQGEDEIPGVCLIDYLGDGHLLPFPIAKFIKSSFLPSFFGALGVVVLGW